LDSDLGTDDSSLFTATFPLPAPRIPTHELSGTQRIIQYTLTPNLLSSGASEASDGSIEIAAAERETSQTTPSKSSNSLETRYNEASGEITSILHRLSKHSINSISHSTTFRADDVQRLPNSIVARIDPITSPPAVLHGSSPDEP